MAKEFFKNLPSQETPFNASRWNGLLNGEESMGSIVVEDVTCKNLCNGISLGYYLTTAGTSFGRTTTDNGLVIKVEENTDYTISTTDTQARYRIAFTNTLLSIGGSSTDTYNALTKDGTKENITRNSGTYKYLIVNATDLTKIQVEKGNKATDLTPYKKFGYNSTDSMGEIVVDDIKCKNDFPLLNNFNSAGVSITSNSDGTYNITGTATANIECVIFKNIEDTIIKNGGTYTLSTNQTLPTGVNSRIEFYNNASYVRGFLTVINAASNNPTAVANTANVNRVRFGLFVTSGTTVNITNLGVQLEKGKVASKFVKHKEFSNKQIYSTNEQRIGTWIDGKPLYRKVIDFGALPNTTSKSVAHGISNIDYIVDIRSTAALPGGDTMKLDVSDKDGLKFSVHISANNTNITVLTGSDRSGFTRCYVTLEYTKTTDGVATTSLDDTE